MRKINFLVMALTIFFLQSCVQTKPYNVGDNIDAKYRIVNMNNLEKSINSIAKSICSDNLTNIAMGSFINMLDDRIDNDGKYLSFDLKNKIQKICKTDVKIIDINKQISIQGSKIVLKSRIGSGDFILGTYKYDNRGYNLFVQILNLKTGKTDKFFAKRICDKKIEFSIDALHIPQEVVIKPLW